MPKSDRQPTMTEQLDLTDDEEGGADRAIAPDPRIRALSASTSPRSAESDPGEARPAAASPGTTAADPLRHDPAAAPREVATLVPLSKG
jgi:hypothetical protein